jgi:hypothetical protein
MVTKYKIESKFTYFKMLQNLGCYILTSLGVLLIEVDLVEITMRCIFLMKL